MKYYFYHYGNAPKALTEAFDNRYTAQCSGCYKYMDKYFSPTYINKFKQKVSRTPVTLYWPFSSKILWSKPGGDYTSEIKVMRTQSLGLKVGAEIKEMWKVANNQIQDVVEVGD